MMDNKLLNKAWPEWEIEKELGRGTYGVVYKAIRTDSNVESYSAIKVISIPSNISEVDSLRSEGIDLDGTRTYFHGIVNDFVSEIQLMQSLKGIQNIVSVEDYKVVEKKDEIGWDIFIRMELLIPFNTYICDKKMTESEVIKLGSDICTALEICGKKNIIHRDIKPENIFINEFGDFKLGDFGIARKLENTTGGLSTKGTYNYMAPEVVNSASYDARVDIYSLGLVLYRLLNENRMPFLNNEKQLLNPNDRREAIERRIQGEQIPAPCGASQAMANLILRACAYDPAQRFSSASDMKQALQEVKNGTYKPVSIDMGQTVPERNTVDNYERTTAVRKAVPSVQGEQPKQVNTFGEMPKKKSKMPGIIAVALILFCVIGAGIYLYSNSSNNEDSEEPKTKYSKYDQEQIEFILEDAETYAENGYYADALGKIQTGLMTYSESEDLQNKAEEYTKLLSAQAKEQTLAEAQRLAEDGDYQTAMTVIQNAVDTYGEDADYKKAYDTYQQEYYAQAKATTLKEAQTLTENGDYPGAMTKIQNAIDTFGEDPDYKKAYETYQQTYYTQVRDDALAAADVQAQEEDYLGATQTIRNAMSIAEGDTILATKADEYEQSYVLHVIEQAEQYMAERDYFAAKDEISNAMKQVSNNNLLKDKLEEINAKQPYSLALLTPLNTGNTYMRKCFEWNDGTPVDPFGNDYSQSTNYCIFEQSSGWRSASAYAEYRLYGKYSTITGKASPYTNISENGAIFFQIYADDKLVYTSPELNRKTDLFNFSVDIENAEYIKVVVCVDLDKYVGSMIWSDVMLWVD